MLCVYQYMCGVWTYGFKRLFALIYLSVSGAYMYAQIRDTPNQDRGQIRVYLPTPLNARWCTHIGDDHAKREYAYCVAAAVRQAGSTREAFLTCWQRYRRAAKSKGEKHFHEDVFRRFCAAGFGRTTDDGKERRLEFVRRILTENHEPKKVYMHVYIVC